MKKAIIHLTALIALSINASYAATYTSVEDMVSTQKTIRVILDAAPGYGNQSATINLMNRLRTMHFDGTYELVYPDDNEENLNKVIKIFNLPEHLPPVYKSEDKDHHKITFISKKEYNKLLLANVVSPVVVGITGALDSDTDYLCDGNAICKNKVGENLAKYSNASVFIELQPWYAYPERDGVFTEKNPGIVHVSPPGKFWVYPVSTLEDAKKYLREDTHGKALLTKIPALQTLIDGIDNKSFNMVSVYGFTFQSGTRDDDNENFYPSNIMQVITAVRYAQLNGTDAMHKPVIIAVYYDFSREVQEINEFIHTSNWGKSENAKSVMMRGAINKLELNKNNVFLTASLADSATSKLIQSLKPGQVLLLSLGPLPKTVFDGLYGHTGDNIWPQFREGENSLSLLIQQSSPNFRCNDEVYGSLEDTKWEPGLSYIKDAALKARLQQFYSVDGFCAPDSWTKFPEFYSVIGQFIMEANSPDSAFSQSFVDLHNDSIKPENDRIYRSLQEALKALNNP
jgi:hypothetical protein